MTQGHSLILTLKCLPYSQWCLGKVDSVFQKQLTLSSKTFRKLSRSHGRATWQLPRRNDVLVLPPFHTLHIWLRYWVQQ